MLRTQQNPEVLLETTIYKPDGPGPFPLVVMNHGSTGFPRKQTRDRPLSVARYFLERGYMVAVPMRQGFSKSSGTFDYRGCDVQAEALAHAQDIRAALIALEARPDVDAKHALLMGQSHGGMATLAAGSLQLPGVHGIVVFSGVMGSSRCWNWPVSLIDAAGHFGKTSRTPNLWFYGSNDHYIPQPAARSMAAAFDRSGGYVRLVTYPDFKDEGHFLLYDADGRETWEKPLSDFLEQTGMPHVLSHPEYSLQPLMPVPPASNFATLDDVSKVPLVGDAGRKAYRDFLNAKGPRAFAISSDGASGFWYGARDNLRRALASCASFTKQSCYLYAVNDTVVWDPRNLPTPAPLQSQQWRPSAVYLFIIPVFILVLIGHMRRDVAGPMDNRQLTTPRIPVNPRTAAWHITRGGIAWCLLLIAIPASIFIWDPLSYWSQAIKENMRVLIFLYAILFSLGNWLASKLGSPLLEREWPESAEQLMARAVKKGYRRP